MSTKTETSDRAEDESPWPWLGGYLQHGKHVRMDLRIVFEPGADFEWSVYKLDGGNPLDGESFTHSMEVPLVLGEAIYHLHVEGLKLVEKSERNARENRRMSQR